MQVRINITDVNDNAPKFAQEGAQVVVTVREDHEVTSPIYRATATDSDSDANGDVTYSIKFNSGSLFQIDPTTGVVTLTSSLDYETSSGYTITIMARDGGSPVRSAELQ